MLLRVRIGNVRITLNPEKFYVIGNNLALDFINTVNYELTLENLLSWAIAVNLVKVSEAEHLSEKWNEEQMTEISLFRERLREVVINLVNKKNIPSEEISWINRILREKGGYPELSVTEEGFSKSIRIDLSEPNKILIPITESFVDLICYGQLNLLRKCERTDCILYFYDTTKNHKRRWCSMAICGNRAKVAAFYKKKGGRND